MKFSSYIAISAIAVSAALTSGRADAQDLNSVQAPAEFPPASYTARQYVDSNGCVFVRAGIDGNVSWIPRVSRDRQIICGFQPSLARATPEPEPVAAPEPAPAVTVAAAPAPAPEPAPAPAATQVAVATQPTTPTLSRTSAVAATPQPAAVIAQPAPQPTAVRVVTPTSTTVAQPTSMAPRQGVCRGASAISAKYLSSSVRVRCGPQQTPHVSVIRGGNARTAMAAAPATTVVRSTPIVTQPAPLTRSVATTAITSQTRVAPKRVYEAQIASVRGVYIPEGYRAVWDDDRLSTTRAHQTFAGMRQMELVWTNTVPRILVDRETGREVTYLFPGLMYPHTSWEQQNAANVTISTRGSHSARPAWTRANSKAAREGGGPNMASNRATPVIAGASAAAVPTRSAATVSTRSAATIVRVAPTAPSHRYVQVGIFSDHGHARAEAQRIANSGLPTKLGKTTRGGKSYGVVISGPYSTQAALQRALQQVRGMGFGGASLRK